MSKIGDHFFEFPVSRGTQGDSIVLMLTVPARTLTRVLASDNYGDTLDRSQRELNPARAKKFISISLKHTRTRNRSLFRRLWVTATRMLNSKSSETLMSGWPVSRWMPRLNCLMVSIVQPVLRSIAAP